MPTCDAYVSEDEEPYVVQTSRGPVIVPPLPPVNQMASIDQARYWLAEKVKRDRKLADFLVKTPDLHLIIRVIAAAINRGLIDLSELEEH